MLLPRFLLCLAAATSLSVASPVKRANAAPTAVIANGTVEGVALPTFDQDAFLGVPFAQPPLGDLRLRHPRSLNTTYAGGVHEAKKYSTFCAGVGADNWPYEISEDCLYLNVVRPAGTKEGDALPVGFWIYGGGYQNGGSGDMRYNSSWIVQRSVEMGKPIMVVSTNYRTSALGFLNSAEVVASGEQNFGSYDQRLALNWVHENIKAFGGAPDKVSIWGESAGGFSVGVQLLGYGLKSSPLFRGAIMESGTPALFTAPHGAAAYQAAFDNITEGTGCGTASDKLQCLRGLTLKQFNDTASAYSFSPVVDGNLIARSPTEALKLGEFVPVPLLLGANLDEGASFGGRGINTTEQVRARIAASIPASTNASIDTLLDLYPNDPTLGSPFNQGDTVLPGGLQQKRFNAFTGDLSMHAGRRRMAETYAAKDVPVFSYHFKQAPENATNAAGVGHFVEIAYVYSVPTEYKTANTLGNRTGDAELAHTVTSQWVSFIHDQTPNNHGVDGVPNWPDYRTNASNFVHTRQKLSVEADDYRKEGIAFMNSLAY